MNLREATNFLLTAPDIGGWIRLADSYIQTYNRTPSRFILPADHAILQPVIEAFASDVSAFSDYIRALRDAVDGAAYDDLHALYRTISVRALQLVRRARLRKATLLLLPEIEEVVSRAISYDEQTRVARYLETAWGAMRMETMNDERNSLKAKRLTSEDRSILLDGFWKQIDNELDAGRVPQGDQVIQNINDILK